MEPPASPPRSKSPFDAVVQDMMLPDPIAPNVLVGRLVKPLSEPPKPADGGDDDWILDFWKLPFFIDFRAHYSSIYHVHSQLLQEVLAEGANLQMLFQMYHTLLTTLRQNTRYTNPSQILQEISQPLKRIYEDFETWEKKVNRVLSQNYKLMTKVDDLKRLKLEEKPLLASSKTNQAISITRTFIQEEERTYLEQAEQLSKDETTLKGFLQEIKAKKSDIDDLKSELEVKRDNDQDVPEGEKVAAALAQGMISQLLVTFYTQLQSWMSKGDRSPLLNRPAKQFERPRAPDASLSSSTLSMSWLWRSPGPQRTAPVFSKPQFVSAPKSDKLTSDVGENLINQRVALLYSQRYDEALIPQQVPELNLQISQCRKWKEFFEQRHKNVLPLFKQLFNLQTKFLKLQILKERLVALKSSLFEGIFDLEVYHYNTNHFQPVYLSKIELDNDISNGCDSIKKDSVAMTPTKELESNPHYSKLTNASKTLTEISDLLKKWMGIINEAYKNLNFKNKKKGDESLTWVHDLYAVITEHTVNDENAEQALKEAEKLKADLIARHGAQIPGESREQLTQSYQACGTLRQLAPTPEHLQTVYQSFTKAFDKLSPIHNPEDTFELRWKGFLKQLTPDTYPVFQVAMQEREKSNREMLDKCFRQQAVQLKKVQNALDELVLTIRILTWDAEKVKELHKEKDPKLETYVQGLLERFNQIAAQRSEVQNLFKNMSEWLNAVISLYKKKQEQSETYNVHLFWNIRTLKGVGDLVSLCNNFTTYFEGAKLLFEYSYNTQVLESGDKLTTALNYLIATRDNTGGIMESLYMSQMNTNYVKNPFRLPMEPIEAKPAAAAPPPPAAAVAPPPAAPKEQPLIIQDA